MASFTDPDRRHMDQIAAGLPTKSEKIRRLAAAGFKRADIARYLEIRYQHVRNVLTAPSPKTTKTKGTTNKSVGSTDATRAEGQAVPGAGTQWVWTKVGKSGRINVPEAILDAIGVHEGDPVQLSVEGGVIRLLPRDAVIREVQAFVRRYVPDEVNLVDELLVERRMEATREEAEPDD